METPPNSPPAASRRWPALLRGMLLANAAMGALYGGLISLGKSESAGSLAAPFIVPSLFIIPLLGGLMAAWCWRRLTIRIWAACLHALCTTLLGCTAAAVILQEGSICLLISFPLLYVMVLAGILMGGFWFSHNPENLRVTIIPLVALLGLGEMRVREDQSALVTDEILVHASPDKVWPHVLAFPQITERAGYWIFRAGLPYPMETTNGGNFAGADRQCIFSDGVVIRERVAEFVPDEMLTFDIVEQPTHPEAYGHITLQRGQFRLRDNHDGTTTLIGSSWYTLHVRPLWYFDLWAEDMTRAVHLRVMKHIRHLAEA